MKKLIPLLLLLPLLFAGCQKTTEHVAVPPHEVMGVSIEIPPNISGLAKAYFEATDMTVNAAIDAFLKKKPEFISFEFSSDVKLSNDEKSLLLSLFSCYDTEISDSGIRTELTDIERGITVGYGSIDQTQTSDCDLTIAIKIYYGRYYYTYCSDFIKEGDEYVLFRFENLNRTRYLF